VCVDCTSDGTVPEPAAAALGAAIGITAVLRPRSRVPIIFYERPFEEAALATGWEAANGAGNPSEAGGNTRVIWI
jgi:hypothetical protein